MPLDVISTRGNSLKLFKSNTRSNAYILLKLFYTQQVIGSWNTSPDEVVKGNNIGSFKSKLNEYWKLKEHGYAERLTAYCYLLSSQTAKYRITQCT